LEGVSPNELLVMDSVKHIKEEYRFIISTLETPHVVTYSHYKGEISRVFPIEKLLNWVKDLLREVQFHPDSLYVLDIGIKSLTNKIGVVELNSFSCSDWYKCDLKSIVSEANQLAEREFKYLTE
jgi:ATP-grasp domain, R2K clade family 3